MAAQNQVYPSGFSQGYIPHQQQTNTTVVVTQPGIVVGGGCGYCGSTSSTEDFTALGIILCICCFPWGLLCCLLMKEQRCSGCGRRQ